MSLRQKLNNAPAITTGVVGAIVVVALWFLWSALFGGTNRVYGKTGFFSDDDGKSYFKDDITTLVPYTKGGKEVVRAHVFKCPSKGTFVGYLQRYTPKGIEAVKEVRQAAEAGKPPSSESQAMAAMLDRLGSEYKKPGAGNSWKKGGSGDVVVTSIVELCDNKPNEFAEQVIP